MRKGLFVVKPVFYRETWAEIDLNALDHNMAQIQQKLPSETNIMAVVKANGYGHGAVQIARRSLRNGAKALAVALLEEALILRKAGINAPILVLSWVPPRHAHIAAEHNITLTFFQREWLQEVKNNRLEKKLKVHMKWDTGMGRVGIRTNQELLDVLEELKESSHIYLTGVYTHFATADKKNLSYFHQQIQHFKEFLALFKKHWSKNVLIHIGNSAASIRFPKEMYQYIRYGIAMYGLYPSNYLKESQPIKLKQVFSLYSRLVHVKQVAKGESISYDSSYRAEGNEWIGTILIGYGDGWLRKLQGAQVLVDGERVPIVGRICMDQTMIRLKKEYPIGTKVTLIGSQKEESIEVDEIANHLGTINYEIPCMINERVPRIYKNE